MSGVNITRQGVNFARRIIGGIGGGIRISVEGHGPNENFNPVPPSINQGTGCSGGCGGGYGKIGVGILFAGILAYEVFKKEKTPPVAPDNAGTIGSVGGAHLTINHTVNNYYNSPAPEK